jgi:hypothetical protein
VYCTENSELFYPLVSEFDRDDAPSGGILQEVFKDSNEMMVLKMDLAYIRANSSFLSQSITNLEINTNLLSETVKEIKDIQDQLGKINGPEVGAIKQKLCSCFSQNEGFKVMCEILCILEREDMEDLSVNDTACYKCARLLLSGVDHTFSQYRSRLHDN